MDFGFNEEQQNLGETVGNVLADFPALAGPDLDRAVDVEVWNALANLGLFSLLVPDADGGVGLSLVDCALAIEALGAGLAPPVVASTLVVTEVIARFGSSAQRARWLSPLAAGEVRAALAVSEAGLEDPTLCAVNVRSDALSGTKIAVAGALDADLFLVTAHDGDKSILVLVERSAAGVEVRPHESLDPSAGLAAVSFNAVALEATNLIGDDQGHPAFEALLDLASTVHAGLAIGIASRMHDVAVNYAKTREQFGQAIGAFQSIKHRCADTAVAVEAGQATAYYAFWSCSEGMDDRSRSASSAKAYCTEIARDACNDAIQIHGGMGFTWELGLHRYLRRAKILEHAIGTPSWHYARVLSAALAIRDVAEPVSRAAA